MTDVLSWHAERYPRVVLVQLDVLLELQFLGALSDFLHHIVLKSGPDFPTAPTVIKRIE